MYEIADWIILILLVGCAISDWRRKEIPLYLLIVMSVNVLLLSICVGGPSVGSRIGGALIGILLFIVGKFTREAIGYGDSWIILLLGVYLGSVRLLELLLGASLLAALFSLFYLWKKRWKKKASIPFVPFLLVMYLGGMYL